VNAGPEVGMFSGNKPIDGLEEGASAGLISPKVFHGYPEGQPEATNFE